MTSVKFALRHKTTGYWLAGLASVGEFRHSPNENDAAAFDSFDAAEVERRQLHEFAGAWMSVPLTEGAST